MHPARRSPALRDVIAARAPVTYETVCQVYGSHIPKNDSDQAAFFAVWALLCREWADAVVTELNDNPVKVNRSSQGEGEG